MAQFVSQKFAPIFIHGLHYYGQCDQTKCEACEAVKYFVRYGTGTMIRDLLTAEERRLKGSDAIGVKTGEMTFSMAEKIVESEPYYPVHVMNDPDAAVKINMMRIQKMLTTHFPGIDLFDHMEGEDLGVNIGTFIPFLTFSNQLFDVLKTMYHSFINRGDFTEVPQKRMELYLFHCAMKTNIIAPNPNITWGLTTLTEKSDLAQLVNTVE